MSCVSVKSCMHGAVYLSEINVANKLIVRFSYICEGYRQISSCLVEPKFVHHIVSTSSE